MADVADLIPLDERVHRQIIGNWFATFGRTPTSLTDPAYMIIPDIDPYSLWGPCYWMPRCYNQDVNVAEGAESAHMITRALTRLPVAGDFALVAFDNRRLPWVVTWWPKS